MTHAWSLAYNHPRTTISLINILREYTVVMTKLLFPKEDKVSMDIAQVDGTDDFLLTVMNKNMTDTQRTGVDLNESPFKIKDGHLNRLRALSKTVELGKRFFPRCSAILNKIMDGHDYPKIAKLQLDSHEESPSKKQRLTLKKILATHLQKIKKNLTAQSTFHHLRHCRLLD